MAEKEYVEKNRLINTIINSTAFYNSTVLKLIKIEPTADVQEVRHGKWIISSDGYYPYCSECWKEPKEISEFCPHCGAKMDKE